MGTSHALTVEEIVARIIVDASDDIDNWHETNTQAGRTFGSIGVLQASMEDVVAVRDEIIEAIRTAKPEWTVSLLDNSNAMSSDSKDLLADDPLNAWDWIHIDK